MRKMSNELRTIKCYIKSKLQLIDLSINLAMKKARKKHSPQALFFIKKPGIEPFTGNC